MFEHTPAFSGFSVRDIKAAKVFYTEVLGLQVSEEHDMLQLHVTGARPVLVYPKPNHIPATYTVLNFPVKDVDAAVAALVGRGVNMLHYEGTNLDARGVMRGQGPTIAWFTDPSGNIFSVIEDA